MAYPKGKVLLVAAWAMLCGGFYGSFFYQVRSAAADVSAYLNGFVVLVKGGLYLVAITALVSSIGAVGTTRSTG